MKAENLNRRPPFRSFLTHLNKRYEGSVNSLENLKAEQALHQQQHKAISLFIRTLKKNPAILDTWDDIIWTVMVEKGVVQSDGSIA